MFAGSLYEVLNRKQGAPVFTAASTATRESTAARVTWRLKTSRPLNATVSPARVVESEVTVPSPSIPTSPYSVAPDPVIAATIAERFWLMAAGGPLTVNRTVGIFTPGAPRAPRL